mgnify:CR=1 FL=1
MEIAGNDALEKGVEVERKGPETSAREDDTQILSWSDAAGRINELLDSGEFSTNIEISEALDCERNRI